jgi:hypothetical protein
MATTTIVFDKFAFVQNLEKRGSTRAQAEGIADTVTDIALAQLVSKTDLRDALATSKLTFSNSCSAPWRRRPPSSSP